jgi:hypothetical protein
VTDRDDDGDDDRDDDPRLTSMRAVWLQMRDEEPPQSGLAALLAAAREKAAAMQPKEPWWQRALAVLRRPPVLAIASAVVLVGGAVLITNRRDAIETAPPIVDTTRPEPTARPDNARTNAPSAEDGKESKIAGADAGVALGPSEDGQHAASSVAKEPPRGAPAPQRPEVPPPPPLRPKRVVTSPPTPIEDNAQTGDTSRFGRGESGEKLELNSETTVTGGLTAPSVPKQEPLAIAQDDDRKTKKDNPTAAKKTPAAGRAAADSVDDAQDAPAKTAVTTRRLEASIDQLVQQCESAAVRGDCAAVRIMAGRIKKTDPGAYRDRVERNTKITRCLK